MAQQTYLVDATGVAPLPGGATRTSSLTAAANAAIAGDTILVQGLVDLATGQILGYSEQAWYPYQQTWGAETFPILLKAGVTLKPADSTPVYVWSITSPTSLIELQAPTSSPVALTRIEGLTLIGGIVGVQARQTTGTASQTLLKSLVLNRNAIGAEFAAESTNVGASVRECVISDFSITTPMTPPQDQGQSIGLKFEARDGGPSSQAGNLQAEVVELTTSGAFANMAPLAWNTTNDLERDHGIQTGTRLIEVHVHGSIREHPSAPTSFTPVDISDVQLTVQGGDLDGRETSTTGWDVGLYTSASSGETTTNWDYYSGYRVSVSGTSLHACRLAGILATTTVNTRGRVETVAQTEIFDVGTSSTHVNDDYRRSGVHLFALEGYLGFIGMNASSSRNTGNGIWAHHYAEILALPCFLPQGTFVGLFRFEAHENDGNGIEFHVGDLDGTGIVGGTAHYDLDGQMIRRHLSDDGENFQVNVGVNGAADLEFGQGRIDRCAISNNGEGGIFARSQGTFDDQDPDGAAATINCRISNSFIWNNPRAAGTTTYCGLFVQLDPISGADPDEVRGLCLLPVTHCTFANNGGTASWSAEFEDGSDASASAYYGRYAWSRLHDPYLATALYDSIFYRDIPSYALSDFGPNFELDMIGTWDSNPGGQVNSWEIGVAGIRAQSATWAGESKSNQSTPSPFVNFVPNSLSPLGLFLNPSVSNISSFSNNTAIYLPYNASETNKDYTGDTRPSVVSGLRDKGGEEL